MYVYACMYAFLYVCVCERGGVLYRGQKRMSDPLKQIPWDLVSYLM